MKFIYQNHTSFDKSKTSKLSEKKTKLIKKEYSFLSGPITLPSKTISYLVRRILYLVPPLIRLNLEVISPLILKLPSQLLYSSSDITHMLIPPFHCLAPASTFIPQLTPLITSRWDNLASHMIQWEMLITSYFLCRWP